MNLEIKIYAYIFINSKSFFIPLAATKSAKNIQHAAIKAANPSTNPINSQLRAPLGPNHPPE